MPLALQSKLLRVLQEREVEPLGSNRVERVDVRVIAASSRDLAAMVADGRFRADLYYRLAVLPIRLPPLRERLGDLEALAEVLIDDIARRSALPARQLAPDALEWLAGRAWPGNIRELRNVLEQAVLMNDDRVLHASHFAAAEIAAQPPPGAHDAAGQASASTSDARGPRVAAAARVREAAAAATTLASVAPSAAVAGLGDASVATPRPLAEQVEAVERAAIAQALAAAGGNRARAARLLGMPRSVLYQRLQRWPEIATP
jgi:DNA-binding NtrC family response regulator